MSSLPRTRRPRAGAPLPARAGIGLRAPHYRAVLETRPAVAWLETHSENYFGAGGPPHAYLERIRALYPLSLHGVGLSLGSTDPLDGAHLVKLKGLLRRYEPALVSDHLCWSSVDGIYLNDLLPLPYTEEALDHLSARVRQVQDSLATRILVENPSSYLRFAHSTIAEWDFLAALALRTDCGILLDVNNVHVSAVNHGFDAARYLDGIPRGTVAEIHLAGFAVNRYPEGEILIDHHGAPVAEEVWQLYEQAIERFGPLPTLIEWDTDLPELEVLVAEAEAAERRLEGRRAHPA